MNRYLLQDMIPYEGCVYKHWLSEYTCLSAIWYSRMGFGVEKAKCRAALTLILVMVIFHSRKSWHCTERQNITRCRHHSGIRRVRESVASYIRCGCWCCAWPSRRCVSWRPPSRAHIPAGSRRLATPRTRCNAPPGGRETGGVRGDILRTREESEVYSLYRTTWGQGHGRGQGCRLENTGKVRDTVV